MVDQTTEEMNGKLGEYKTLGAIVLLSFAVLTVLALHLFGNRDESKDDDFVKCVNEMDQEQPVEASRASSEFARSFELVTMKTDHKRVFKRSLSAGPNELTCVSGILKRPSSPHSRDNESTDSETAEEEPSRRSKRVRFSQDMRADPMIA